MATSDPIPGDGRAPGASATRGAARDAVDAQHDRFGGIKWGAAFFGWLSANGLAVILIALASAGGLAIGLSQLDTADDAADQADTIGVAGGIVLLVVLFLAYLAGGYVAGRMARFDGARQGVAAWVAQLSRSGKSASTVHHAHRVIEVDRSADGRVSVRTQGDANEAADPWTATLEGDTAYQVRAVVPELGHAIQALRAPVLTQTLLYGVPALLAGWVLLTIWRPAPETTTTRDEEDK